MRGHEGVDTREGGWGALEACAHEGAVPLCGVPHGARPPWLCSEDTAPSPSTLTRLFPKKSLILKSISYHRTLAPSHFPEGQMALAEDTWNGVR